ncbi:MAG: hypothetical protein WCK91_03300 [bacterium]
MQEFIKATENKNKEDPENRRKLNPGMTPIFVCLTEMGELNFKRLDFETDFIADSGNTAHDVDYQGTPRYVELKGFLQNSHRSYVISNIDSRSKYSRGYNDCTGLIISGVAKGGEKISFVTHQDPKDLTLVSGAKESFLNHLRESLAEMWVRCGEDAGNIDAVVIGGRSITKRYVKDTGYVDFEKNYEDLTNLLSTEVRQGLGFEPVIVNGPKFELSGSDDMYFNTPNNRMYLIRPRVNPEVGDVTKSDLERH